MAVSLDEGVDAIVTQNLYFSETQVFKSKHQS